MKHIHFTSLSVVTSIARMNALINCRRSDMSIIAAKRSD
jgi:hypothetical protein